MNRDSLGDSYNDNSVGKGNGSDRDRLRNRCWDKQQLVGLLEGEISSVDSVDAMNHLEQCAVCRKSLEDLSAEPNEWKEVCEVLSSGVYRQTSSQVQSATYPTDDKSYSLHSESKEDWTEALSKRLLSPSTHPEMLGRIGRYDIERMLGVGGMGIVFRGFDTELHRVVAIKVLSPTLAFHGTARQRFAKEARAAAAVVHEDVVPIYDVETQREIPFLVMRFIPGESLQSKIDREGALELKQILRIAKQLMAGLAAAHAQGLIHRDIKPANVLLEEGIDRALLTDFGLAQTIDDARVTASGMMPGTPPYMSPEQARGERLSEQSDLFSAGSVLYAMCTGRAPFRGENSWKVLKLIEETEPRPIRELQGDIPEWLARIISKMMAKDPAQRYKSAAEVSRLFEQCLAYVQHPLSVGLPEELTELARVDSTKRRLSTKQAVATISVGILCLATGFIAMNQWKVRNQIAGSSKLTTFAGGPSSTIRVPAIVSSGSTTRDISSELGTASIAESASRMGEREPSMSTKRSSLWKDRYNFPPQPEEHILRLLSEPIEVDLRGATLPEALKILFGEIPVDLVLTAQELAERRERGLESLDQLQVSFYGSGTRRQILQRILSEQDLGYVVHATRIEVATKEAGEERPVVRAYGLSYVTEDAEQAEKLIGALRTMFGKQRGPVPELTLQGDVLIFEGTEQQQDRLIELLAAMGRQTEGLQTEE